MGLLAITSTHLTFEMDKPSTNAPAALFIAFEKIASCSMLQGNDVELRMSSGNENYVFQFEEETQAKELQNSVVNVMSSVGAHSTSNIHGSMDGCDAKALIESGANDGTSQKRALCIKDYRTDKEYHLKLTECDKVTLIKDEAKDELWYGECDGKEGYFEQSCVILMPMSLSHLQLSQEEWKRINSASQKLEFKKGDVVCHADDFATIGMLYFVMKGVCVQVEDEHPIYYTDSDVFGELGVLCGTKMSSAVVAFSETVLVTKMDCRQGSALSALLETDVTLAFRLFRYVAGVCATRSRLLEEVVHQRNLAKAVVREKIKKKPKKKKQTQKIEFEGDGITDVDEKADQMTEAARRKKKVADDGTPTVKKKSSAKRLTKGMKERRSSMQQLTRRKSLTKMEVIETDQEREKEKQKKEKSKRRLSLKLDSSKDLLGSAGSSSSLFDMLSPTSKK